MTYKLFQKSARTHTQEIKGKEDWVFDEEMQNFAVVVESSKMRLPCNGNIEVDQVVQLTSVSNGYVDSDKISKEGLKDIKANIDIPHETENSCFFFPKKMKKQIMEEINLFVNKWADGEAHNHLYGNAPFNDSRGLIIATKETEKGLWVVMADKTYTFMDIVRLNFQHAPDSIFKTIKFQDTNVKLNLNNPFMVYINEECTGKDTFKYLENNNKHVFDAMLKDSFIDEKCWVNKLDKVSTSTNNISANIKSIRAKTTTLENTNKLNK